jgi:hypothetical protein
MATSRKRKRIGRLIHPQASVIAPGAHKNGRHEHRWRIVADGQGRICEICGRGEIKVTRGWKSIAPSHPLPTRRTKT